MSDSKPDPVDGYDERVFARLLDFFDRSTRWQRGLWGVGTVVLLREALEASSAVRDGGILSPDTLKFLLGETVRAMGLDPGIGDAKKSLSTVLGSELEYQGAEFRRLHLLIPQCEEGYLNRWAATLATTSRPKAERAARAIAGHLLGLGFSADYLHRWFSYRRRHISPSPTLREVIEDAAQTLATAKPRRHVVLVVFLAQPSSLPPKAPWLSSTEVSAWLRSEGHDTSRLRQHGGVIVETEALDPRAAVDTVADRAEAIATRIRLGVRGGDIRFAPNAWVKGKREPYILREPRRVEVRALEREQRLFDVEGEPALDAALHLLAPLDDGPTGSAVAGGWAAIESVLSMPGDRGKVAAADRAADLVAASWPRAELTALAHRLATTSTGPIVDRINAASTNRDRAAVLAKAIQTGSGAIAFANPSDAAALARMREVLSAPLGRLDDVRAHASSAVRRLYRQRNLVLHGGRVESVALRPALRAAAPLIGAAFDRIAHAWLVDKVDAKELAARARIRLEQCGTDNADVSDLLEPRR